MLRSFLVSTLLAAGLAAPLAGQANQPPRAQLDYFVSRFQHGAAAARPVDGLGGRLMWAVDPGRLPVPAMWAGVYALHTARDQGLESWRIGGQADAAILRVPGGLPLRATVTLGAGLVHVSEEETRPVLPPPNRPAVFAVAPALRRFQREETRLSVAPGIGARVEVSHGTGLRADLRRVWDFGRTRSAATELSAGITLPL